jgi:tetratricopeptide (TPR) repeat protein
VTEEALSLEWSHKPNTAIALYNLGSHNLRAGNLEAAREWLERALALTLELGFKEVMAYTLSAFVQLSLLEGDAARAAHLAGIADRQLSDAGILLQAHEQARFEEAKATAGRELGDAYAVAHDAAMNAPLEEALRLGGVLAEASASP